MIFAGTPLATQRQHMIDLRPIDDIIRRKTYVRHPFVENISGCRWSRAGLRFWAVQKYHQTYLQNCSLSALHSKLADRSAREFVLANLIAEETGAPDSNAAHYVLMRQFARAVGATDDEIDGAAIGTPVLAFVDFLVTNARMRHPVLGLLCHYTTESQVPHAVSRMYEALRRDGFSERDLTWFRVHAKDEHADGLRPHIERLAASTPRDFTSEGCALVSEECDLWLGLHSYYDALLAEGDAIADPAPRQPSLMGGPS